MRRATCWLFLSAVFSVTAASSAAAAGLEPIGSFKRPIFVTSDPGDPDRLLIVEREGRVIEAGPAGMRLFADISSFVACCDGERGLLSIAPAPDFAGSGRFYAAYTGNLTAGGQEGDIHVDSFRPDASGGGQAIREPIISIGHAQEGNHNGGQLQLGPDGHLYISTGDGGGGGDPFESGQDTETLLGKILRIEPLPGQEPAYSAPAGNPFLAGPGRDEIWAFGLRNPWRFSFDRVSGDMVIADVGQGAREEIDHAPSLGGGVVSGAGPNYGWNCREGTIAFPEPAAACASASGFTDPVFEYPHDDPEDGSAHGCSIIGGYVVRDASLGDLYGRYLYTDFCTGELRSLQLPAAGGVATGDRSEGIVVTQPMSFGEDSCGRVYLTTASGAVHRLIGPIPSGCSQSPQGVPGGVAPGLSSATSPRSLRLRLSAKRVGEDATPGYEIWARLSPCNGGAGQRVRLKKGGRHMATKRFGLDCLARFRLRVARRATFRAVLASAESGPIRSPRLVITPGPRSGS